MKKTILVFIIFVLIINQVFALRTCQNVQEANVPCQIVTPIITDCSTYDLYNSTLELNIDEGSMTQIGSTGVYNFTFNQPDEGTHKIIICNNQTTATIEVADYSYRNIGNTTLTAQGVWDLNITDRYSSADDDNFVATLAGEKLVQALRFIIQIIFGGY